MTEEVAIRRLVAGDVRELKACFERCYGDSYVVGDFYDLDRLRERITSGRLRSVVAESANGEIVGHIGLTLRHPDAKTVDAGNTIVDPRFRGRQIVVHLGLHLNALCADEGFLGYHHYPTTVHAIMQELSVADEGTETGVMLAYIPAGTEYRELGGEPLADRTAVTVVWRPFAPCPPRTVYAPADYSQVIGVAYSRARLEREFATSLADVNAQEGIVETLHDPRRGLLRFEVRRPGRDLPRVIAAAISDKTAEVVHVDLSMSDPATPAAANALRNDRFLFCAVLPEYLAGDVLRLQRLRSDALPRPDLVNPDAQEILRLIERDHQQCHAGVTRVP